MHAWQYSAAAGRLQQASLHAWQYSAAACRAHALLPTELSFGDAHAVVTYPVGYLVTAGTAAHPAARTASTAESTTNTLQPPPTYPSTTPLPPEDPLSALPHLAGNEATNGGGDDHRLRAARKHQVCLASPDVVRSTAG